MADAPNADTPKDGAAADVDASVEGGNYEVIRKRLVHQGAALRAKAETLNKKRQDTFGGTELAVLANGRARTEHNCVPRDLVMVQGRLLLGFDVTMGLKQETRVSDVFAVQSLEQKGEQIDFTPVPTADVDFLADQQFQKDFTDLFRYYRDARLVQLRKTDTRLLAIFQVGATVDDIKVCRWRVETGGRLTYIDNRGERDHVFPASHDFEWTLCTREMQVPGTHPHINILDTVFVETVGGDLTIKVEDNTADGQGIYREPVDDANQTLDDAEYHYARLGGLILLKIKPYREDTYRYLVYNTRTQSVARIDAIGRACVQLPEDHGIIFPGGYYLQSGEWKVFPDDSTDLEFKRVIKAPNGEDVLYVFHRRRDGLYTLLPYNLIRKAVQTPIPCHGYSLFADGTMVVFRSLNEEPTRVHPLQVWRTPFESAEHAASAPTDDSFLAKVGNADLVRGISDALSVARLIDNASPSRQTYEDLIRSLTRMKDSYYWLGNDEVGDLAATLAELSRTAELIVDEFEKVVALRARAAQTLAEAEAKQAELLANLRPEDLHDVESYLKALTALRTQRGHLITIRETRYIDLARLDALEAETVEAFDGVTRDCVRFLLRDEALGPLTRDLENLLGTIEKTEKVSEIEPLRERLEALAGGLDLLTEVVSGLQIDDATQRTTILEGISEVFGQLNRVRATLESKRKSLMSHEGKAEFGAQFKLFGQSVQSALAVCDTPERCDDELGRLMVQLEELEARFSEFDEFLGDLAAKRDEVYEAFNTRKQTLLDERQRRAGNIQKAADRILDGVQRRARSFANEDELNAYFASDGMVMKLRQLAEQLAQLGDGVKAEELLGKLKGRRQDALRGLRDKLDLFEGGDNLIRFGNHQFAVNTQPLELTMVPRDDGMVLHLTGTDFYEPLVDEAFEATRSYWPQTVVSEDREVYRGEYLAARILFDAEAGREGLTLQTLIEATREAGDGLLKVVRGYAQERYDEGYERGLHDQDATLILDKLIHMRTGAGLLRFGPAPRAVAALFWGAVSDRAQREAWHRKARNLGRLRARFGPTPALTALADTLADRIATFLTERGLPDLAHHATLAGRYLVEELTADQPRFTTSREAIELRDALLKQLESNDDRRAFEEDLRALKDDLPGRLALARAWLDGLVGPERSKADAGAEGAKTPQAPDATLRLEAAVALAGDAVDREPSSAVTRAQVTGLLGQHARVVDRTLTLQLDEFLGRLTHFIEVRLPGYRAYRALRQEVLDDARQRLRLDEFKPRVMSAFVRNKLINDVYLPIIGDNLAKQMGAAGAGKRTDLMGLLLLISPPGYGKTTLMEYVANRLGLVFVKVNGPSLGHSVASLDPSEAPNATARQEVDKVNLALEMGNNVMLYLDDIQHTHPEFLQKFISLCDATRRIEGVWRGRTRTYDLRGKKFAVVMAGNPYTETGDKFQIPDMLANRADTYNLGDILEGRDQVFSLSYIENALTSNSALAPLAARDQGDVYKLIRMARGEEIPTTELKHGYSAVEVTEITSVLKLLFQVQDVVLKVNQQYILSAGVDEAFRAEPSFKLQGSYRNMNKMAEKVVAAMNPGEVESLIDDHYQGEAQTLTTGAEHNLLKLAELRGRMGEVQKARWEEIKRGFRRVQTMGGADDDPAVRMVGTLAALGEQMEGIRSALGDGAGQKEALGAVVAGLQGIAETLRGGGVDRAVLVGIRDALKGRDAGVEAAAGVVGERIEGLRAAVVEAGGKLGGGGLAGGSGVPGLAGLRGRGGGGSGAVPPPLPGEVDGGRLADVLAALGRAVELVGRPQLEVTVNTPRAVEELLAQQVQIVERTLVPLVKVSADNLRDAQAIGRHVTELVKLLRDVDGKLRG